MSEFKWLSAAEFNKYVCEFENQLETLTRWIEEEETSLEKHINCAKNEVDNIEASSTLLQCYTGLITNSTMQLEHYDQTVYFYQQYKSDVAEFYSIGKLACERNLTDLENEKARVLFKKVYSRKIPAVEIVHNILVPQDDVAIVRNELKLILHKLKHSRKNRKI